MNRIFLLLLCVFVGVSTACSVEENAEHQTVTDKKLTQAAYQKGEDIPATAYLDHNEIYNPESVIPPQCYTKTDSVNNPCYVCHQTSMDRKRPNFMGDGALQGDYQFSEVGMSNSWVNLFKGRSEAIAKISDAEIDEWVSEDNFQSWQEWLKAQATDHPAQAMNLEKLAYPEQAFDEQGFAKDGSHWVAYNYKPFPSAFWPTNGATGDAMIRLPKVFREKNGKYHRDVYLANLSLLELAVKNLEEISVSNIDETVVGADLDGDGEIGMVDTIIARSTYVADAADQSVAYMLYPEETEFLHSVRYLGVNDQGDIFNAPRMKELRYMRKHKFKSAESLKNSYYREAKEKEFEQLPKTINIHERGIDNSFGWTINAFIEDAHGELRQQVHQELAFCNGCHKTVGSTIDQIFSFARKVDGSDGWKYIDLTKMHDAPNLGETKGEFLTYFERVKGGDEFRQNEEMLALWFDEHGEVDAEKVKAATSLYELITPSPERARALNKSYRSIVSEQSYIYGRDPVLSPATNVLEQVDDAVLPLRPDKRYVWDMRLQWAEQENTLSAVD